MSDERTPLLQFPGTNSVSADELSEDLYMQFCRLIGTRPLNLPSDHKHKPAPECLYNRVVSQHTNQNYTYMFTATLTNTLILSQVVLGAAVTGLGASDSSRILITVFGALNTVIAGLIAFLKSRGQPMRARMFRDDLAQVVDEIENSATMWLGISRNAHGYEAIDIDDQVTVRSEVARLTRLYDRAMKMNALNNPDTYSTGAPGDPHTAALRIRPGTATQIPVPPSVSAPVPPSATGAPAAPVAAPQDPDASPATKPPEPTQPEEAKAPGDNAHAAESSPRAEDGVKAAPAPAAAPQDPDASPATQPLEAPKPKEPKAPGGKERAR